MLNYHTGQKSFFFQAEDGIRDLVRSRGLGDVYKRQEEDSGLTRFGQQVIREMNRVGMVVDMSHSAERSTLEAINYSEQPVIISHANPSHFHPALRNKSDKVLDAVAANEGLLGFSLYPFHLKDGPQCTLESFADMVAWTAERMGVNRIGFGSDLCQAQPQSVLECGCASAAGRRSWITAKALQVTQAGPNRSVGLRIIGIFRVS